MSTRHGARGALFGVLKRYLAAIRASPPAGNPSIILHKFADTEAFEAGARNVLANSSFLSNHPG